MRLRVSERKRDGRHRRLKQERECHEENSKHFRASQTAWICDDRGKERIAYLRQSPSELFRRPLEEESGDRCPPYKTAEENGIEDSQLPRSEKGACLGHEAAEIDCGFV